MARKRADGARTDRPARLRDDRFAALGQVRSRGATSAPASPAKTSAPPAEDDAHLFREAVGDAQPLREANRVELDAPRPAPLPRPVEEEHDEAARPPGGGAGPDDFRSLMHDVTPLAPDNRAELDSPPPAMPEAPPPGIDPDDVLGRLAAGTVPLKDHNRVELNSPPPPAAPRQREADERAALRESLDQFSLEDRLDIGEEATFLRDGLPRRVLADLRRGRWVVQGEIDLHGLTRDEARAALGEFLAAALRRGRRCVRVVHGKGLRSPGKVGVLKHLSRGWLAQREEILAFCQARDNEGGSGALRVLLRAPDKARK